MAKSNSEYVAERFKRNKKKALDMLGGVCVQCDSVEQLEFHHVKNDREGQLRQISVMLRNNTWSKIEAELVKCELLCKPCHQRESLKARGYKVDLEHGDLSMYKKRGCRCSVCRATVAKAARDRRASMTPDERKHHLAVRKAYRDKLKHDRIKV